MKNGIHWLLKNCTAGLLNFTQQRCYTDKEILRHHHPLDSGILSCPPTRSFWASNKKGCFLSTLSPPFHLTPPPRPHYIKTASNKRWVWTAGMQVWLQDLQDEDQRACATRRDFQGEHFKYSVECITPSGHSHSSITNWNHFNSSCVGLDPIGITSSSNGWRASWGPKKKHNHEEDRKISEIMVSTAQMCRLKITCVAYRHKQIARKRL